MLCRQCSVVQWTQECTHVLAGHKKAHNKSHDESHIDDDDKEKLKVRISKILKLRMKLLRIVKSR